MAQVLYRDSIVLVVIMLLSGIAYFVGLPGGYVFDDYPNIVANSLINRESWSAEAFLIATLSGESGPTGRPIAMLSFALDSFFWDLSPQAMKWENIILHGFTGFLFFCLLRRVLECLQVTPSRAFWVALVSASIWVIHPLNLTSVLYIVQRMNLLSTLFCILALLCYVEWRALLSKGNISWSLVIGFGVTTGLSIFSKENGILIFLYVVLIEIFVFSRHPFCGHERLFQRILLLGTGAVCFVIWYVAVTDPTTIVRGYGGRDFTIDQRLLTEFRVVTWYIYQLFSPTVREMSLYHDDIVLSEGLLTPVSTIFSLIFLSSLLLLGAFARKRFPFIALSVFLFFASQLLESFTVGLEVAYEHRVYFGGGWLIAAMVYAFSLLVQKLQGRLRPFVVYMSLGFLSFMLISQTQARAQEWSSPIGLIFTEVRQNPGSYRANVMAGGVLASRIEGEDGFLDNYLNYLSAMEYFDKAMSIAPSQASACIAALILETRYQSSVPGDDSVQQCDKALSSKADSSSLNSLGLLVKCVVSGKCTDGDYVLSLLDRAYDTFGNRGLRGKSIILAERASYYANVKDDLTVASLLLKRAIELNPSEELNYIKLIDVWVRGGNVAQARNTASELMMIDPLRKHASVYEALKLTGD